ncbi:Putative DH domain, PB1 domain, pleckstrin domain, PH-like domain superfamily [Septoria linicola]|uniref:DH domain, PB1 domain, pleckstrin domain, PH-like domain superfamily n=1 Tax=Septoria linicola TaxID=215465 RepID=A0A9Q9EK34_9PEZI|nr:Putative DH domain, PB1 domain, pleckstrin domain, PH-like domain superfamily [Septoria linicola]
MIADAVQSPLQSQGSNYSIQSQFTNRSSGATQDTSRSTLFTPPPMPTDASTVSTGGMSSNGASDVVRTDNIMNSVADASSSLFQICVALRQRLLGVEGFSESLAEEEEEADDDTDPVTLLWRTFRRGYPLMLLYNALRPTQPLSMPQGVKEEKKAKAATFKFIQACITDLKIPNEELFIITDLYGDDTTGFVKVARIVNRVLDVLVQRGLVEDVRPTASDFEEAEKGIKRTQRQHIISELVKSERTYVQHLELLQAFKHLVEEKGVIPGDAVHDIFLNLNSLLDFQRRFLIRVEQTNALPEEEQNWGKLFLLYCEAFKVYEPYIANQRKCEKTVIAEFGKLKDAGGSLEMRQMVESPTALHSFLMKPFQRLTKYPLLLEQLHKKGDLDEERKQDLVNGIQASTSVLTSTNRAVDQEEKREAVQELKTRVEDWKGHRVEGFGDLLLYGTFTVLKSENLANGKDGERQYHVYLFETILLCCKNIDPSKPKNKLSNKPMVDNKGKPKLQLKGRIFMQNVTDLVSLAKPGMQSPTALRIRTDERIFWKGDPSIENFIIRFTTEETLRKWAQQIEVQRRRYRERTSGARNSDSSARGGTSATEFTFMQNQPALENPYRETIDEDEDEDDSETMVGSGQWSNSIGYPSGLSQSRNGSSSSLRSRSTTGESAMSSMSGSTARTQAPRLPSGSMGGPLSLRTREVQQAAQSPGSQGGMDSYFSPIADSPMSSMSARTSASSGMYSFPRQNMPQNGYYEEGHGATRFTAPAMGRQQPNGFGPAGRVPSTGRPGAAGMHSSVQMPGPRNRSASSPDIHNGQRLQARSTGHPPVPELPTPYSNPNRSMNNSPAFPDGIPERGSPEQLRQRQSSHNSDQTSPVDYSYPPRPGMMQHASARTITPGTSRSPFPAAGPAGFVPPTPVDEEGPKATPAQLKVRVICPAAGQTLTLVVSTNISYQVLKDRIDAKLQRSTNLSLGDRGPQGNHVKLKYLDEDDFVSIQSDEDVQTAFETWKEQRGGGEGIGSMGEIELFCQR